MQKNNIIKTFFTTKITKTLIILVLLLVSSNSVVMGVGFAAVTSKPYVSGTTIYAGNGTPLRLQGFNAEPAQLNSEDIQWLKNNGFNNLRLNIMWHRYEPQKGVYSNTYFNKLDEIINLCEQNDIYVILNFHQMVLSPYFTYYAGSTGVGFPTWLISGGGYQDSSTGAQKCAADFFTNQGYGITMRQEYLKFWQYLVNRYRSYNCVWAYELINEPTVVPSASWTQQMLEGVMDLYETMTPLIRQIDPKTIIIYHYINFNPNPYNYNDGVEHAVPYPNIVWTRSWYDVAYGGYSSSELGNLQTRITNIKNKFNGDCQAPFINSEMGLSVSEYPSGRESSGSAWIRDSFDTMRNVGLNNGYECYSWYHYHLGPRYGYWSGRNSDGSNTFITPVLKEYITEGTSPEPEPTTPPSGSSGVSSVGIRNLAGSTDYISVRFQLFNDGVEVFDSEWTGGIMLQNGEDYTVAVPGVVATELHVSISDIDYAGSSVIVNGASVFNLPTNNDQTSNYNIQLD